MRILLGVAALLLLTVPVGPVGPVAAQVSPEDLEEARREMGEVQARLDDMAARYEAAVAEEARLQNELSALRATLEATRQELEESRELVRRRAAEMYMEGTAPGLALLLDASSVGEVPARLGYLEHVGAADQRMLRRLEVARRTYGEQVEEAARLAERQEAAVAELEARSTELTAALEEAGARYNDLLAQYRREEEARRAAEEARRRAEEEARRRAAATSTTTTVATAEAAAPETTTTTTAPPAPAGEGMYCPVQGIVAFTDTWGAPRSGGRAHQGVDLMAARGTPVVAIEGGSVRLRTSVLGGITIWLYGAGGTHWYYAHLDGYADGLGSGQQVGAGELLGYVGSSGNASAFAPHLHFEQHPGGGAAINPYPLMVTLCR